MTEIEKKAIINFIKENYDPVDDKPGYVWFSKRHFEIISIETLAKSIEDFFKPTSLTEEIIDQFNELGHKQLVSFNDI